MKLREPLQQLAVESIKNEGAIAAATSAIDGLVNAKIRLDKSQRNEGSAAFQEDCEMDILYCQFKLALALEALTKL